MLNRKLFWRLFFITFSIGTVIGCPDLAAKEKSSSYIGYLFVYFEGTGIREKQEQLRFACSADAKNWHALNKNLPVLCSDKISQTGGIRDPHILRGEDGGTFYMVATDMFAIKNGWDSNPGIVMLKSDNLIDWKHSTIDLAKLYPKKFGNVKWVWAPQTIYDPEAGKYLVYFTVRLHGNNKLDFYSAYANSDFNGFEKEPELMFSPKYGGIDGDIVYNSGTYHFFFKGNTKDNNGKEFKNGIQQATSKSLRGPWKEDFKYLDVYAGTTTVVEGSSIFKLNGLDEYILMYDVYADGCYEFQRSTNLFDFSQKSEAFKKNFNPRHGSIISITKEEALRLQKKWGDVPIELIQPTAIGEQYHFSSKGNPVITHHYTTVPAAFVENDTLWLFTGHDNPSTSNGYNMKDWLVFSTVDLKKWIEYPVPLKISDFSWVQGMNAYASHVVKRNGKYYCYVSTNSYGVGVAIADRPEGSYKDIQGKPLLTYKDCFGFTHSWACIDPAVFIDDDGQACFLGGNKECYYAKLKENMIELDGEIKQVEFDGFVFEEAPWIHKRNGQYYLTYASGFPGKIAYAISENIKEPWKYKEI